MAVQPPVEEDHLPLGDTRRRASLVAGRLSASYGIVVYMYIRDHGVPHVHARYGDDVASVELATGVLLAGSLQPRQAALVREWVDLHRGELPQAWELLASGEPPGALGPLLEPLRDPDYFARVSVGPKREQWFGPKSLTSLPRSSTATKSQPSRSASTMREMGVASGS